jgi:F0F1-type ATP synthase membrane subunit a
MRFCLSLSLSIWMGIITYAIINYFNDTCSHLTPLRIIALSIMLRAQILLIILEIAVAFIQSYVFTILRTLYRSEI